MSRQKAVTTTSRKQVIQSLARNAQHKHNSSTTNTDASVFGAPELAITFFLSVVCGGQDSL